MPKRCAFGCEPSGLPTHRFPSFTKFPDRFKAWVTLCGGKLDMESDYDLYQNKVVCDRHFTDSDRNRNKRLNAVAVPSLYLSGTLLHVTAAEGADVPGQASMLQLHTTGTPSHVTVAEVAAVPGQASVLQLHTSGTTSHVTLAEVADLPGQASVLQRHRKYKDTPKHEVSALVLNEHNYTAASSSKHLCAQKGPKFSSYERNKLRTQIKRLRSEVCRCKKTGDFKKRLGNAHKLLESVTFKQVIGRMSKPSQLFVNMQLQTSKNPKGRRFTIEEKILSLSLYKKGPKCYALLQKYFTLPSAKAMKRLLGKVKLCPGINPVIFEKIKKSVKDRVLEDRLCSLAFDEMSLTPQVNYNAQKDIIEGFASNNDSRFADHVLVFMVKGIKQNFKQPIAYYFTSCLNKSISKQSSAMPKMLD